MSSSKADAGRHAHFTDEHYREAGATIVSGAEAEAAWGSADIIFRVYPITPWGSVQNQGGGDSSSGSCRPTRTSTRCES